jgi:ATP-binding cassette, subfamily B, bacterial
VIATAETPRRRGPVTASDLSAPANRRLGLRRVPELTHRALAMLWDAGRMQVIAAFGLQAFASIMMVAQLLIIRQGISKITTLGHGGSLTALVIDLGALVGITVAVNAAASVAGHQQSLLVELLSKHVNGRIIDVASTVEMEAFDDPSFYDDLDRARTSALVRSVQMVTSVTALFTGLFMSAAIAFALLILQPLLLPFVALAGVPVLAASIQNSRKAYLFEWELTPQNRERSYLIEVLTHRSPAKELRVFDAIPLLRDRYDTLTDERLRQMRAFVRDRVKVSLVANLASTVGLAIAVGSLAWLIAHGGVTVPTAITAALAMQQLSSRVSMVTISLGKLIESGMFIDDYHRFLELEVRSSGERQGRAGTSATPAQASRAPSRRFESVRLDQVSFAYPHVGRLALDSVSMEVNRGEVVALVGENGSGKTTLVKLVSQLYRPTAGRVLWNEADAQSLDREQIHEQMTVLFQDFVQYHLPARENIALGRAGRSADRAHIVHAATMSGAHEFLSGLPQGYETRLGRQFLGGHELSVGQWQRVALARAFFRGGDFLILDEPTASLDARAEHDLFRRMRTLAKGRSVLLISHRFSSVRDADRIYVLGGGEVLESGDHDQLMARGGRYAELFTLQASAYRAGLEVPV